jgi:hypothetical protein
LGLVGWLGAKTTIACHAILSKQPAQCSDIHKLMTADSNVPFHSSRPWTVHAINLLQGHLIPRAMTLPCTCPLYPWPKTRPHPIRPILGSSKESVSRRRQPNHEKMPNVIPVAEAPPLQAIRQSCPCAHCHSLFPSRDRSLPIPHYAHKRDHVGRAVICGVVSSYFVAVVTNAGEGGKRTTSREPSTACPHPPPAS